MVALGNLRQAIERFHKDRASFVAARVKRNADHQRRQPTFWLLHGFVPHKYYSHIPQKYTGGQYDYRGLDRLAGQMKFSREKLEAAKQGGVYLQWHYATTNEDAACANDSPLKGTIKEREALLWAETDRLMIRRDRIQTHQETRRYALHKRPIGLAEAKPDQGILDKSYWYEETYTDFYAWCEVEDGEISYLVGDLCPFIYCSITSCDLQMCPLCTDDVPRLMSEYVEREFAPWHKALSYFGIPLCYAPSAAQENIFADGIRVAAWGKVRKRVGESLELWLQLHPEIPLETTKEVFGAIDKMCLEYRMHFPSEVHGLLYRADPAHAPAIAEIVGKHFVEHLPGLAINNSDGVWYLILPGHYLRFSRRMFEIEEQVLEWNKLGEAHKAITAEVQSRCQIALRVPEVLYNEDRIFLDPKELRYPRETLEVPRLEL